jgi:hypothetical protein
MDMMLGADMGPRRHPLVKVGWVDFQVVTVDTEVVVDLVAAPRRVTVEVEVVTQEGRLDMVAQITQGRAQTFKSHWDHPVDKMGLQISHSNRRRFSLILILYEAA